MFNKFLIVSIAAIALTFSSNALAQNEAPEMKNENILSTINSLPVAIKKNETFELLGLKFEALSDTIGEAHLSSNFISFMVFEGEVKAGRQMAKSGQVLVAAIDSKRVENYTFDALVFKRTIPPHRAIELAPVLDKLIAAQDKLKFWGLLEAVDVNLSAPLSARVENIQSAYLLEPEIIEIRQEAKGDVEKMRALTAQEFIKALSEGQTQKLAALLDPKPYSDVSSEPEVWKASRQSFAQNLAAGNLPKEIGSNGALTKNADNFIINGTHKLTLVRRNSAFFVSSVEAIK